MSRVITYSTKYPAHHFKSGEPTYFVEKFYKSLYLMKVIPAELQESFNHDIFINGLAKHHTIRKGNRWKKGDLFSPRIWGSDVNPKSGRSGPYHSKQIILAPDQTLTNVWDIEIQSDKDGIIEIGIRLSPITMAMLPLHKVANNDGLTIEELISWFNVKPGKKFIGQILCWNSSVNY